MIKEGYKSKAKYWGNYTVERVVKLDTPVLCHSKDVGAVEFMPTIVQLKWETPPSEDINEFWFPYWVKIKGKEKYGQFAPMLGQHALLELFEKAIREGFFDNQFLSRLKECIERKQKTG